MELWQNLPVIQSSSQIFQNYEKKGKIITGVFEACVCLLAAIQSGFEHSYSYEMHCLVFQVERSIVSGVYFQ